MKKKLLVFSLIALLALTITSCAKKSFSVTINLEEGEEIVGIAPATVQSGSTFKKGLKDVSVKKEGHSFKGWSLDGISLVDDSTKITSDVSIWPIFEINEYTLTIVLDGKVVKTSKVKYGEPVTIPAIELKQGFTFNGWSDYPKTMPAYDLTINGSTTKNIYKIKYVVEGKVINEVSLNYGDKIAKVDDPTLEGYEFIGWSEQLPESMPDHDIEVHAIFNKVEFTITYMVDGTVYKVETYRENDTIQKLTMPSKEGYTFSGWDKTLPDTMPKYDIVVNGTYEKNQYTITYKVDGVVYKTIKAYYNDSIALIENPSKNGYTFSGWNVTGPITVTKDMTITGTFTPNSYKITYNLNGGSFEGEVENIYTEGKEFTLPIPIKTGYRFLGWSEIEGSTTYISVINKKATKDFVLYANWAVSNEYKITYVYEEGKEPTHTATSLEEFAETFWKEFYAWSGSNVGLDNFKNAALASWKSGKDGGYKAYKQSASGEIDNGYFANTKGNDLWMNWFNLFDKKVTEINGTQSAWASTYVGYLRLYAFFAQSAAYWTAERTKALYEAYPITTPLITKYTQGDTITLVELTIDDGRTFLGWYDAKGNRITEITSSMSEDLVLTAKWSASTPVESFDITNSITKIAKFDTHQLEWTFNPTNATNKRLKFSSSDNSVLTIDENGLITAIQTGKATITVEVLDNSKFNKTYEVTVYVDPFIDATFENASIVKIGETTKINANLKYANGTLKYKSNSDAIARVDENGVVTAVSEGYTVITIYLEGNENVKLTLGVTVVKQSIDEIFEVINKAHNDEIKLTRGLFVAYAYHTDVISSASDLLFNYEYSVDSSYLIDPNTKGRPSINIDKMEFITVHYTAGTPKTSDGGATASYFRNVSKTTYVSANYCVGNDGIFMSVPDGEVAYHAGDGSAKFTWTNTKVKASANVKPNWGVVKNSNSSTGYYFTLNGSETTIEVPITGKTSSGTTKTMTDPSKCFTFYGPAWKVVDGYYYMGTTWACFTQTLEGRISSRGGNMNSVGIETACNIGSDLWYTYQITAQLVARLLDKYNLDTTRVVGHNMFSGKDCPQTLLANNGELWYRFMECVEAEYEMYEKGQNYTVTCKSNNPDILADNGRILSIPRNTQTVSYTVTVKDKTTGETRSATYSTIVHGQYTE